MYIFVQWEFRKGEITDQLPELMKTIEKHTSRNINHNARVLPSRAAVPLFEHLFRSFDKLYQGFGKAPKFPQPSA